MLLYAAPAAASVISCLLALSAYFGLYDYLSLDQKAQIRGLIAGFVLRFGLFWGTWLAMDACHVCKAWHFLRTYKDRRPR